MSEKQQRIVEWYESLNEAERLAVDYWLMTGDTRLIDAFKPTSERLQQYNLQPFTIAELVDAERRQHADDETHEMSAPPESYAGYRDEWLDDAESVFGEGIDLWPHTDQVAIVFPSDFSLN